MRFIIEKSSENITSLVRRIGYIPEKSSGTEFSCAKPLSPKGYPRFHIYITKENGNFIFNLHLDQKKPSYAGITAHSGEYEGPLVEGEEKRIKNILQSL